MKLILKYLKPYWVMVIGIIVLLIVQAFCDLSLPQYTSEIIDVGITNRGVEHIVPEKITEEDFQMAKIFMNEEEAALWEDSFGREDDILVRAEMTEEELDALDAQLQVPIMMDYQLLSMAESEDAPDIDKEQMAALMADPVMLQQMLQQYREKTEETIDVMGPSLLMSMGAAFASRCDENAGMDMNKVQMDYLWTVGRKMLLIALLILVTSVLVGYLASGVGASIGRNLRHDIFHRVIDFSNNEINHFSTASLITRSTNDIQQIQMVEVMILRMVLYAPIMGIGGIYMVLQTHSHMEWIIVLAVVSILALVAGLMRIALPKFRAMQRLIDGINMVSREILTGLSVIRAFGREKEEEKRFNDANVELTGTQLYTSRTMVFMMPGMSIIMYGVTLLIVWIAANKIDQGTLQIGTMTAFITYSMMIVMSFLMLTAISIMLPRAGVAAERINEVINTDSSIRNPEADSRQHIAEKNGVVAFDHVNFSYPGAQESVLSDITFTAEPGKTTAIIGSTGSGKSTLINLIPRFYDVSSGSISIDGVDIRDLDLKELRDMTGFVPQKGVLFSGTIASNLRFGDDQADEKTLQEAADIAQATEFINAKTDGMDSAIAQGGSNVSGGQKQRLAIARAIVRRPKIMIFDDSFSALDMKTDAKLRRALDQNLKDSTVIIVAQRISTILNADQILVMDNGSIVGKGTHSELLKTCSVYREIASSQLSASELGLEGEEV